MELHQFVKRDGDAVDVHAHAYQQLPPLEFLINSARGSDSELAATIFADGQRRRAAGVDLSLGDYLRALPDLSERELSLDAAIGVCTGRYVATPQERARRAARERERHPDLAGAIDLALCLDQLMGSADASATSRETHDIAYPLELGPLLEDGKPRYLIRRIIGRGASSVVLEAEDRLLSATPHSSRVAIKLFQRDAIDPVLFEQTLAEARKARSIQHPGVVRVLDVGKEGSSAFIVHEHVPGQTLDAWLNSQGKQNDTRAIVAIMRDIASALAAIHAAGICHRDLKPANVLVTDSGTIRILDFGASRTQDHDLLWETSPAQLGTLAFMAPEQFTDEPAAASPAADIYSLGAMMFWLFVGASPHGSCRLDAITTLSQGVQVADLSEALTCAGVCSQLRRIILRALAPIPSKRHTSADRLASDLDCWLAYQPIEWQRPGIATRTRLFLKRRPYAVGAACLMTLLAAAGTKGWMNAVDSAKAAREAQYTADVNKARVEAEVKWKAEANEKVKTAMYKVVETKNEGLVAEVLTSLWIFEWIHGPAVLQSPELLQPIWSARTTVLEKTQARLQLHGDADTVTSQLISPSLALWYIRANKPQDALRLLTASEDFWSTRTTASDPWVQELRSMSAAARLLQRLHEVQSASTESHASLHEQLAPEIKDVRNWISLHARKGNQGPILELLTETLNKVVPPAPQPAK